MMASKSSNDGEKPAKPRKRKTQTASPSADSGPATRAEAAEGAAGDAMRTRARPAQGGSATPRTIKAGSGKPGTPGAGTSRAGASRSKAAKAPSGAAASMEALPSPVAAAAHSLATAGRADGQARRDGEAREEPKPNWSTANQATADESKLDGRTVHALIAEAAYYRAERRGFAAGDPLRDWLEAEAEVRGRLQAHPGS